MNFSKLSKEKRTQLVMVVVLTVMALGGLGFGLIKFQYGKLREIADKTEVAEKRLKQVKSGIDHADQIEAEFNAKKKVIAEKEEGMASGDKFSWALDAIRRFKLSHKVEIPQISQPTAEADVSLLAKFPYKQVTLKLGGTGYYHDLGKFIADFENQFPYIRVVNLTLEPVTSMAASEKEKLAFTMDIVPLVKP